MEKDLRYEACTKVFVIFNANEPRVKRNSNSLFDVTMGSYDGAEVCELIGLFALNIHLPRSLAKKTSQCTVMMVWQLADWRKDGLADKARKDL